MSESDTRGVLQELIAEVEKKNSWGKNELINLIARLCARALDRKAAPCPHEKTWKAADGTVFCDQCSQPVGLWKS